MLVSGKWKLLPSLSERNLQQRINMKYLAKSHTTTNEIYKMFMAIRHCLELGLSAA